MSVIHACTNCSKPFECPSNHPEPHECWSCWYGSKMSEAEQRFDPLTKALSQELELQPCVWQTGGMVMCLAIEVGPEREFAYGETTYKGQAHVLFSEFYADDDDQPLPPEEQDEASFGMYNAEGEYLDSVYLGMPFHPANAKAIAKAAAPRILAFAEEVS